jgi:uncharacterized protein (TIGR02996 family)
VIAKDDPELLALLNRLLAFGADGSARADREVGLVLADWLEERGDPRADDVRALAAFRPPEVTFPKEEAPEEPDEVEEGGEPYRPPQPIWRWPALDEAAPPWWDLLAELDADGLTVYVRWHANPYTEAGRRMLMQTGGYSAGHDHPREQVRAGLERCLAELTAALLGWSPRQLARRQKEG